VLAPVDARIRKGRAGVFMAVAMASEMGFLGLSFALSLARRPKWQASTPTPSRAPPQATFIRLAAPARPGSARRAMLRRIERNKLISYQWLWKH
jgi:hypothetical protein